MTPMTPKDLQDHYGPPVIRREDDIQAITWTWDPRPSCFQGQPTFSLCIFDDGGVAIFELDNHGATTYTSKAALQLFLGAVDAHTKASIAAAILRSRHRPSPANPPKARHTGVDIHSSKIGDPDDT